MRKTSFVLKRAIPGALAVDAVSSRSFARHTHDEYGIGVVRSGAQRSSSGRGPCEAGAGDVITVNPGEVHDGEPIGDSRAWTMLYLSPAMVGAIVADIRDGRSRDMEFTDPVVRAPGAARRFLTAYNALISGDGDAATERLIRLVAGLVGTEAPRATAPRSLMHLRSRIDDDPSGAHPLDVLARQAGISQFQTLRGFARLTGLTPHAYVVQRRLDLARSLIRRGTGLAEAAMAAGFADQSHFHRAFTRRHGFTPGAYARAVN